MVNEKRDCNSANFLHYKSSDTKKLGADAKIIVALIKQQPQKRLSLCESAGINESTFSRYKRLLKNEGIIKETSEGFSLWYFKESPSLWDRMQKKLGEAGGRLIDLEVEKREVGKPDPKTGRLKETFVRVISIQGVMIFRGAKDLQTAASIDIPDRYYAFLFTQGSVDCKDRIRWQDKYYEVETVEEVFDGHDLSYRIAKLVTPFKPWAMSLKW
jgi:hypothetical protein